jgi:26S proteasome regulatory subunit N5
LQLVVAFVCLAPFDNEQHDLANRINEDKKLSQIPEYKFELFSSSIINDRRNLLTAFLTQELMRWPQLEKSYAGELNKHSFFSDVGSDGKNQFWSDLRKRVVEHVIRL